MERYLSKEEFARLAMVLNEAERDGTVHIGAIRAIRLLIFTGCRLGEILSLKWKCIDFEMDRILLPDSKTGRKTVYLSAPAVEILASIGRVRGDHYVLVGRLGRGHLARMGHHWIDIRKRTQLNDVRMHDLRHSYASVGANLGEILPMIGKLLGHTQAQKTARYANLAADPALQAAERIGHIISNAMIADGAEPHNGNWSSNRTLTITRAINEIRSPIQPHQFRLHNTSFGTRGAQVQILPLRP